MANHGFSQTEWAKAKREARDLMVARAKIRGMIAYSELAANITAVDLEAHDPRLFHLLGEISSEEDTAGRGMLSAVVVHKVGDMEPGTGFFELANQLGRDTSDILKCWVAELHRVHAYWSNKP
jgi:hypothetical protein